METLKSLGFDPGALFVNIVGFVLLLWLFRRFLYRPISTFMQQRSQEIARQLEEARRLNEEAQAHHQRLAEELQQEREAARAEIARMTQEAKAAIAQMHNEGRRERQALIEQGRQEIERAKESALAELKQTVSALAAEMAAKVIREALDEPRQEALVESFLHDIRQAVQQRGEGQ